MRAAIVAALVAATSSLPLAAQDGRVPLRGSVVSDAGDAVPFALIALEPGFERRFADDQGRFIYPSVEPGTYRLRVRQVGYSPFDSSFTIADGQPPVFAVRLRRIALRLAELRVTTANSECHDPGSPDSAAGIDLATVFAQLRENAERYRLLTDQYPFRSRISRRFANLTRQQTTQLVQHDTIVVSSLARWHYAPGNLVTPDPERWRSGDQFVRLPGLPDLADSTFQAHHCFRLHGIDTFEGQRLLRVDFRASRRLRDPDVDGSAWLDTASFQIRYARFSLTQLERVSRGVQEWIATTTFRELRPNLLVWERVSVHTGLVVHTRSGPVIARVEEQRLLGVDFIRAPR